MLPRWLVHWLLYRHLCVDMQAHQFEASHSCGGRVYYICPRCGLTQRVGDLFF